MRRVLALLALSASAAALAQEGAISLDTLRTVTETLSSDAYEGRAPTTAGEEKAVSYIVEKFRAAGSSPATSDRVSRTCRWWRSPRRTSGR